MAAGGEDDHISMDDSDRENFRRRGRSPASKRGGAVGRGRERRERERGDHEIARTSEWGDNGRRERSPGSNRVGNGRERERSEAELAKGLERRRDGRRERSPGSIGGGSVEGDDNHKTARGWEREDIGRRRDRSPLRRFPGRERERSEREFSRVSERRESWRRDRSPGSRRGGSRERERGERRYGRGFDREDNGRREISPRSKREDSRDRVARGQNDFVRGGSGRGDHIRRDIGLETRVTDRRQRDQGNDDSAKEVVKRGDRIKRDRSPESSDGIKRGGRDRLSDVDSPEGIIRKTLSPMEQGVDDIVIEKDGREIKDEERRLESQYLPPEGLQETSYSGSGDRKSGDEDSDREEPIGNGGDKPQILSKIATGYTRNATSDDDEGGSRGERTRGARKSNDVESGGSDEENEVEDRSDKKARKSQSRRREKHRRDHKANEEGRGRGARKLDVDNDHSGSESEEDGESDDGRARSRGKSKRREKRRKHSRKHSERSRGKKRNHRRRDTSSDDVSDSASASTSNSEVSESEDSVQREKARKHRKKRKQKEKERELEREKKRRKVTKKEELKGKKVRSELKKKKKKAMRSKKPITDSWGKYGILKDIDMWNKKAEFSAWLAEVKKVNVETLANWEEKQMFKEYMEDYNTATFPSKKYYNLDIYHRRKIAKERMKGIVKAMVNVERTDFNDEDERRLELQKEREQQKQAEVEALMRKMQSGMAQDMREQAQLREDMQYQYRLGNTEAAQAIQRRLDPDAEKFAK